MIGLDDFAILKLRNYGTVFVNHATHRIIDIIDTRDVDNVTAFLEKFIELKVVSRDGSPHYNKSIAAVSRDIVQVTDKFHLFLNLSKNLTLDLKSSLDSYVSEVKLDIHNEVKLETEYEKEKHKSMKRKSKKALPFARITNLA